MNTLHSSLQSGNTQVGTFVKIPSPIIMEVLALSGLDFVILDAEHAPFDRGSLDQCIMTCRLSNLPTLVRVENTLPSTLLNALDCGASGLQIPHVKSAAQAEELVKLCRYGHGGRGYAGSTRAANYGGTGIKEHLENNVEPLIVAQIEDPEGVDDIDAIAAVEGISALFIGRVDLTVAYNETDQNANRVLQACHKICQAAKKHNKPVGIFLPNESQVTQWQEAGVSFFGISSEHNMIKEGFQRLVSKSK